MKLYKVIMGLAVLYASPTCAESVLDAVKSGSEQRVIDALKAPDVNVNAQDEQGVTALMWAASKGNKKIVKMLLDAQANPNVKDGRGRTALRHARNLDIEVLLVNAGATRVQATLPYSSQEAGRKR